MKTRKRIVIIAMAQFGYHIDTYYYCKYLKLKYDITYIGWNHGHNQIKMEGVKVILVPRGKKNERIKKMISVIRSETRDESSIVMLKYSKVYATLLHIMCRKNIKILDVRTVSVAKNQLRRKIEDLILYLESQLYKNITVINSATKNKILLKNSSYILPLGADPISDKLKVYNELNLIYVGTLNNRNIDRLVLGVIEYCKRNNAKYPDIKLTIIGDGYGSELQELHELVENNKLEDTISILGRIPHDRLKPYFDSHNIGVSYIPITKYYDNQPPTKTFEYLTSGMLVLATGTSENINVIDNSNGVIIGDSPEDVCRGIEVLSQNLKHYSSEAIIENSKKYSWSKIIKDFDYYLEQITNPKMSHNSN